MALTKVQAGMVEATGTPSSSTFLRGDGTWAAPAASITSGTAVTLTSQTFVDFTGIPSTAKRITVMFNGVSTNGTSVVQIQLGSGSITTSGYKGTGFAALTSNSPGILNVTSGFPLGSDSAATYVRQGSAVITLISGNDWVCNGTVGQSDALRIQGVYGSASLSGTLDRIRITTVNGTDTFDAGSINILWE